MKICIFKHILHYLHNLESFKEHFTMYYLETTSTAVPGASAINLATMLRLS